tara:strand:- start:230 stop:1681 length:1452 start_codon:yes stop_codon:yes gene_type:complete
MAGAVIEVKYFNTFVLKKTSKSEEPIWNGSFGIPASIGGYPAATSINEINNWAIEESRIRGGYNNTTVDFGVKAYLVEDEPNEALKASGLIYSGIFNSRTGINRTNVFSVAEEITKTADPANGSIQKLFAEETNLTILQELKCSRALINKDAIYSAEGAGAVTSSNLVIGVIQPYVGEYGISKDPGSFASYGYRKYFSDKNNNVILRLSRDGIEEISSYGMTDYFRDQLNDIDSPSQIGKIIGGYDIHNSQYVISTQGATPSKTLSFDEKPKGWVSFFTYYPDQIFSLRNKYYTIKSNQLYQHYSEKVLRNTFYNVISPSDITLILNPAPTNSKTFNTLAYEGSNGWKAEAVYSGNTGQTFNGGWGDTFDFVNSIFSFYGGEYVINPANGLPVSWTDYAATFGTSQPPYLRYHAGFDRKENKYVANLVNNSRAAEGEIIWGDSMSGIKGFYSTVKLSTDLLTNDGGPKSLFSVESTYTMNNGY